MKRFILASLTAAVTFSMNISTTFAQDGPPQFRPVEMWVCSFRDGKDQDDINDVYEMIEAADADTAYAAWQLNSYFTGSLGQNIDFIYLGAWADNSTMGANLEDSWANHPEIDEVWEETVDCQGLMFASLRVQANPEPADDSGNFMLDVRNCTTGHGIGNGQAVAAIQKYNDYRVANGLTVGTFVWFPAYGNGEADFDFKIVTAYDGPRAWGDAGQWFTDNAAYRTRNAIGEGILECDEARMYTGRTLMDNLN
jgi:hypothetical protein